MRAGDWHVMPDISSHFCIPGKALWSPSSGAPFSRPTGREWFELVDLDEGFRHHRPGVAMLSIYWAGAGHQISGEMYWVLRKRPAQVIGQVPADF